MRSTYIRCRGKYHYYRWSTVFAWMQNILSWQTELQQLRLCQQLLRNRQSHYTERYCSESFWNPYLPIFEEAGCSYHLKGDALSITGPKRLQPLKLVRTMPYPGFPTDAQAPVMAMAALAEGTSVFVETIF